MNPIDVVIDYIEAHCPDLYAAIKSTPLGPANKSISVLPAPSSPNKYYLQGVSDSLLLTVYCRHNSSIKALETARTIAFTLEAAKRGCMAYENFNSTKAFVYTNPHFAYMDANETYVFITMVKINFERR